MNYLNFRAEDFALDESFQNWVRQANNADVAFWESWIAAHPHKQAEVANAADIVRSLIITENPVPDQEISLAWQQLRETLHRSPGTAGRKPLRPEPLTVRRHWYTGMAAAVLILVVCGAVYWLQVRESTQEYCTAYGETARIQLPDSSEVVLNGNSRLRCAARWKSGRTREVWLDGEAFFAVTPRQVSDGSGNVKFIVHTPDLQVEVLGTAFNVYKRNEKTRVVLSEGTVKVRLEDQDTTALMQPGEMIEFSRQTEKLSSRRVNPEIYSAWKNKLLIFDHTPLSEVAEIIEETYGRKVIFRDSRQAGRKLSGTIPSDNLDILLLALAKSFNLSVQTDAHSNQVIIH
jgi:transmembrane sensor